MSDLERDVHRQAILVSNAFALRDEEALITHLRWLRTKVDKLLESEAAIAAATGGEA